ncbi:MAG TPA: pitrilysin family protein, partial [Pyrinomonadaceae bacterium]|nr:pitrilysin family protein [Pyrinomonadaceae bacterium]
KSVVNQLRIVWLLTFAIFLFTVSALAQEPQATPPPPGPPRSVQFPKPVEKTLPNGLRVVVVQRSALPLVTARLLIKSGGEVDPNDLAGVTDMTATLLARGTTTRSATQIAEQIEALGGFINSNAGWDSSTISVDVLAARISPAMEIFADVVRNPAYKDEEIERLRKQSLNNLKVSMGQPGQLARFVAGRVIYRDAAYGHPLSGTPESLPRIKRDDIVRIHDMFYRPDNAILVIGGDMTPENGFALAQKYFGDWQKPGTDLPKIQIGAPVSDPKSRRILVIDMPDAGQAAVLAARTAINRSSPDYFRGIVTNAILTGYSGRLNWEIRVKRGLSYGANSVLDTRRWAGSFSAAAQTKNESGAEVAALTLDEVSKISTTEVAETELKPRKASLVGGFARALETNGGLVGQISSLALYGMNFDQINQFVANVEAVKPSDIKQFAAANLNTDSTSLIVVGNAKKFLPALQQQFSQVEVIPVAELDLNSAGLRRAVSKN